MKKLFFLIACYCLYSNAYNIPILMYHVFSDKKERYHISPEEFRAQLQQLYEGGYVTAPLRDIIEKKSYLKKQKVVVLRFDGATIGQFRYISDDEGKLTIDPKCALGILLNFYKEYPSFGKNAVFVLLPRCFEQPEYNKQKLEFLLNQGMELCNHGIKHRDLLNGNPTDVDKEFGGAMAYWEKILGPSACEKIPYLATPFGSIPKKRQTRKRLKAYRFNGKTYPQKAILYTGWKKNKAACSPFNKAFDRYSLPSIEVGNTHESFEKYFAAFQKNCS